MFSVLNFPVLTKRFFLGGGFFRIAIFKKVIVNFYLKYSLWMFLLLVNILSIRILAVQKSKIRSCSLCSKRQLFWKMSPNSLESICHGAHLLGKLDVTASLFEILCIYYNLIPLDSSRTSILPEWLYSILLILIDFIWLKLIYI